MVEKTCQQCSEPFLSRSVDKRKYCSPKCSAKGSSSPLIVCTCKKCGKEYKLKSYLVKYNNGFCGRSCSQKGEDNNFGYKGGIRKKEIERATKNKALKFANRPSLLRSTDLVDKACRRAYTRYGKLYLRLCKDCRQQAWISVLQGQQAESGVRLVIDRELRWNDRHRLCDVTELETCCD